jgi:hypothetical protein
MKTSTFSLRQVIIASALSLSLAAPLMAQQEISPDRFESVTPSSQQAAVTQKTAAKSGSRKAMNQQNAKLQNAHQTTKQTASLKKTSNLDQMARN